MNPGDEAPPETPAAGPNICPECSGSGEKDGRGCENCAGTGQIEAGIGGA